VKKRSISFGLLLVPVGLMVGVWALATIRLQTELLPLFPQRLASVQGLTLLQMVFGAAQELTIVLENPPPDRAPKLKAALERLPEIKTVTLPDATGLDARVGEVAWTIAHLPPDKLQEFQSLFEREEIERRLQQTQEQLAGAVDAGSVALRQLDPLGLLPWLQENAGLTVPATDDGAPLAVLLVQANDPLRSFKECQRFVDRVRSQMRDAGTYYLTGRAAFMAENSRQMERDMCVMLAAAVTLVALAFRVFYRSVRGLLWIIGLQALSCLVGVVVARLCFGELNVISIGFAAILLGVGMDYCILVFHHFAGAAGDGGHYHTLRRAIWLSTLTTAAAFAILCFSSFPGLQQLAVLVGAGLLATAFFATQLLPAILQRGPLAKPAWLAVASDACAAWIERQRRRIVWALIVALAATAAGWPWLARQPIYDPDLNKLRPARSEAYQGLKVLMRARQSRETLDLVVVAASRPELQAKVASLSRPAPVQMAGAAARVESIMRDAGFGENWSHATVALLRAFEDWKTTETRVLLSNTADLPDGRVAALVRVPWPGDAAARALAEKTSALPASWRLLTEDLGRVVRTDFRRLLGWMLAAVVALCWWAHRQWRLVALNLLTLALALAGLLVLLQLTRQSMTVLSLLAVPLLVGLVIDISLHLVLGMEETRGDLRQTFRHMAAPVALTGLCTMIGFGAPALTGQPALQNFGLVMDLGIFAAVVTGLVLLPALYATGHSAPAFYRAFWFEAGALVGKHCGRSVTRGIGRSLGLLYGISHPRSRMVVRRNLGLLGAGAASPWKTFINYGATLGDYFLLGTRPQPEVLALATERVGLEHLQQARADGKGLIVVTAHLGLFEYGALWMEQIKQPTAILTLPEPSRALSEWRVAYRRRWGAETIEVGDGSLSSVEIVRHLKQGKAVAMLMDRPYGNHFVQVDFPGGPVPFATGPVWLSLLSGSPVVPVTIVRQPGGGYRLEAHPPVRPHWLEAGRDETVEHYTRELGLIFREVICAYPDQWYQFASLSR